MEVNLRNLRKDMTQTVLKEVRFDEGQMNRIRGRIQNKKMVGNPLLFSRFQAILSTGVCVALIFGVCFFALQKTDILHSDSSRPADHLHASTSADQGNASQAAQKNVMTKKEVKYKMLNSMDYFSTAVGTMVSTNYRDHEKSLIHYKVKLGDKPASNIEVIGSRGEVKEKIVSNEKYMLVVWPVAQSYLKTKPMQLQKTSKEQKSIPNRYKKNGSGKMDYWYRTDIPPVGNADMSLFPQKIATKYMQNEKYWRIVSQDQQFLNREVIVLGGTFDQYHSIKLRGKSFKFWVDKKTGILLKMSAYDEKGNLVFEFVTKDLKLNQKIQPNVFEKSPPQGFKSIY